ncbi:MAG: hypothetical protein LC798_01775 [Chloroflexi bacterium]|nr:hypothetical protein [Chloroflexota bacterium]
MSQIPALDRVGEQLADGLRRELPVVRRRRRTALVGGLLSVAIVVPAAGTATKWAGLAGGETALPTQVVPQLRATLAEGRDARGRWRVEAYRAAISDLGGTIGVCVFVSRRDAGGGRCVRESRLGPLTVAADGDDALSAIAAGVVRGEVTRVEVTLRSQERPRTRSVIAVIPAPAPRGALRERGLPQDLRSFAVLLSRLPSEVSGIRALDADGQTLAVAGQPAAAAPAIAARPSPISAAEVHR